MFKKTILFVICLLATNSIFADEWVFVGESYYVNECGCLIVVPIFQQICSEVKVIQPPKKEEKKNIIPPKIYQPIQKEEIQPYDPIPVKRNIEETVSWKPEAVFSRTIVGKKPQASNFVVKRQ